MEWYRDEFRITDDLSGMDLQVVGELLRETYWAADRTQETVEKSAEHSFNLGLFHGDRQIGYFRLITDRTTYGYLCDVIVTKSWRGRGLGKWMLECILNHPELKTCRFDLVTKDAQDFYRQYGFAAHRFEHMVRYAEDYAGGSDSDTAS